MPFIPLHAQFERNTANADPLGPAANTMQISEPNSGLLSIAELKELAQAVKRKQTQMRRQKQEQSCSTDSDA